MRVGSAQLQSGWPLFLLLPVSFLIVLGGNFYFPHGATFSDMAITHYPNALWVQRSLKDWGEIPLWSSTILSGYPFMADPLSGLFYPPGWIGILLSEPFGLNISMVFHLVLGGVGLFCFLRSQGVNRLPSLLGGIAFEAMPKVVGHVATGHVTLVYAVAWTPWLLLAERQGLRGWWKTGLFFGLILLADLRWAALAGFLWAAYGIYLSLVAGKHHLWQLPARIGKILLGVVYAILLSAVLLLPFVEYASASTRALMTSQDSLTLSLPILQVLGLLAPSLGGSAEWILYPGAGILALALIGLDLTPARSRIGFWLGIALISLLYALGSNLPGMDLLVRLPGFNLLRVPPRALILTGLGLICAAVWTMQTILDHPESLRRMSRLNPLLLLVGLAFLVLLLAGSGWALTGKFQAGFSLGGVALVGNLALIFLYRAGKISSQKFALLVTAWLLLDLGVTNFAGMDFRSPEAVMAEGAPASQFIAAQPGRSRTYSPSYSLPQHTAAWYGLELADGVGPLQLRSYAHFMDRATGVPAGGYSVTLPAFKNGEPASDNRTATPNAKQLGLLNVGFVCAEYDLNAAGLVEIERYGSTRVYHNELVMPRAWVQDSNAALGENVLMEAGLSSTANRIEIDSTGPGLLVVSEIAYPGWETWMDGQKISTTNPIGLLRGIDLPAGGHHLTMIFQPVSLRVGLLISIPAWLVAAGCWLLEIRRRR